MPRVHIFLPLGRNALKHCFDIYASDAVSHLAFHTERCAHGAYHPRTSTYTYSTRHAHAPTQAILRSHGQPSASHIALRLIDLLVLRLQQNVVCLRVVLVFVLAGFPVFVRQQL